LKTNFKIVSISDQRRLSISDQTYL